MNTKFHLYTLGADRVLTRTLNSEYTPMVYDTLEEAQRAALEYTLKKSDSIVIDEDERVGAGGRGG